MNSSFPLPPSRTARDSEKVPHRTALESMAARLTAMLYMLLAF